MTPLMVPAVGEVNQGLAELAIPAWRTAPFEHLADTYFASIV
jgi:hypothetical protein